MLLQTYIQESDPSLVYVTEWNGGSYVGLVREILGPETESGKGVLREEEGNFILTMKRHELPEWARGENWALLVAVELIQLEDSDRPNLSWRSWWVSAEKGKAALELITSCEGTMCEHESMQSWEDIPVKNPNEEA